jgi:hypothetical protein
MIPTRDVEPDCDDPFMAVWLSELVSEVQADPTGKRASELSLRIYAALHPERDDLPLTVAWLYGPTEGRAAALAESQARSLAATLRRNQREVDAAR